MLGHHDFQLTVNYLEVSDTIEMLTLSFVCIVWLQDLLQIEQNLTGFIILDILS